MRFPANPITPWSARGEGLHEETPREFCPECEQQRHA